MIRLEPFQRSPYRKLISWIENAELLMQFAGPMLHFPLTEAQLDESLADQKRLPYTVIENASDDMVGYGEIYRSRESAFLGRLFIEEGHRGRGYGLQMVKRLIEISFLELDEPKAELNVFEWNVHAISCYKKAGFILNPYKKVIRQINGNSWAVLNMELYRTEWRIASQSPDTRHLDSA
jgi:RimJ/RimL family protein N-acetyltransferase